MPNYHWWQLINLLLYLIIHDIIVLCNTADSVYINRSQIYEMNLVVWIQYMIGSYNWQKPKNEFLSLLRMSNSWYMNFVQKWSNLDISQLSLWTDIKVAMIGYLAHRNSLCTYINFLDYIIDYKLIQTISINKIIVELSLNLCDCCVHNLTRELNPFGSYFRFEFS